MRRIEKIEDEFGDDIKNILTEMATEEDHLGLVWNIEETAKMFDMPATTFKKIARFFKIPFKKGVQAYPKPYEDRCWVKYGVPVKNYIRINSLTKSDNELAEALGIPKFTVKTIKRRHHITSRGWNE